MSYRNFKVKKLNKIKVFLLILPLLIFANVESAAAKIASSGKTTPPQTKNAVRQVNTVLSGSGAPKDSFGIDGDFYIDITNTAIYGPKAKGKWGNSINLRGPEGPAGQTGPEGAVGPQGPQGSTGTAGANGVAGAAGPQGLPGIPGVGTAGTPGAAGPAGPAGPTGPQGATGPAGPTGPQGATGPAGATGPTGTQGPVGAKGDMGATGATGAPGQKGETGTAGPAGAPGLQGPQGAIGPAGPAGPTGPQGPQGLPGPQGPQGVPGATGPQGPAGADDLLTVQYVPIIFASSINGGSGSFVTSNGFGSLAQGNSYLISTYISGQDNQYKSRVMAETLTLSNGGNFNFQQSEEFVNIQNASNGLAGQGSTLVGQYGYSVPTGQGNVDLFAQVSNLDVSDTIQLAGYAIIQKVSSIS